MPCSSSVGSRVSTSTSGSSTESSMSTERKVTGGGGRPSSPATGGPTSSSSISTNDFAAGARAPGRMGRSRTSTLSNAPRMEEKSSRPPASHEIRQRLSLADTHVEQGSTACGSLLVPGAFPVQERQMLQQPLNALGIVHLWPNGFELELEIYR
eukprot:6841095-Pyramimonas_sp.AAC.1